MMQDTAKATDIALIEFKGSTLPVLAITLRSLDPKELADAGSTLFGEGAFFDDDLAVLDLSQLITWPETVEWSLIIQLLTTHGLRILGVTRANADLTASAAAVGLPLLALSAGRTAKPAAKSTTTQQTSITDPDLEKIPASLRKPAAPAEAPSVTAPADTPAEELIQNPANLIIDRPLRSGQQVYAKGGDLIILAAVNPGAEVIADGNIHVYAPLRGRALAGARGNAEARILTTVFAAELVSIAGIYRTFEDGVPAKLANQPVQVRLAQEPAVSASTGLKSRLEIDILRVD
ncbi:MAG: putative septum site-determining protein MinC [Pseudomonadota bacterium]|jgi:septum site-determining protein MinC